MPRRSCRAESGASTRRGEHRSLPGNRRRALCPSGTPYREGSGRLPGNQRIALPLPKEELIRPGEPDLLEEGRLLHVALPAGTGRTVVHALIFYGFPGARSGFAAAKEANERSIREVVRYASAL